MRLDAYLAQAIPEISRARVQLLIEAGQVRVDGARQGQAEAARRRGDRD
jgi:23S rRNA pseudouridine1911/1915/1917 synthase